MTPCLVLDVDHQPAAAFPDELPQEAHHVLYRLGNEDAAVDAPRVEGDPCSSQLACEVDEALQRLRYGAFDWLEGGGRVEVGEWGVHRHCEVVVGQDVL